MSLLHSVGAPLCAQTVESSEASTPKLSRSDPEPGHGSITYQLGFFNAKDSGDGNSFLDESLTVIDPVVIFDRQVTERAGYTIGFSFD